MFNSVLSRLPWEDSAARIPEGYELFAMRYFTTRSLLTLAGLGGRVGDQLDVICAGAVAVAVADAGLLSCVFMDLTLATIPAAISID